VARVPGAGLVSELKPELKVVSPQAITLIARPRIRMRYEQARVEGETAEPKGSSRSVLSEAFVQWTLSENVTFAYGKQYFSWGGTESLTPTNRLFHETALARNVLYDVRGKNLARVNLSVGRALSLVLMTEYEDTGDEDDAFVAGETFESKALAKAEVSWNDGSDFFGIVAGGREEGRPFFGEYVSWTLPFVEGFSVYGDASHERGADVWYPGTQSAESPVFGSQKLKIFEKSKLDDDKLHTLAVAGLRYDFENGATLRAEYIRNDAGYDEEQTKALHETFSPRELQRTGFVDQSLIATNFQRAHLRGTELPGQKYAYASLTWPKAFENADLQLFARSLYSLTDRSSSNYAAAEYAIGDAGTAFYAATLNAGEDVSELKGLTSTTHVAGYRHTW
jgi:hypothetical protein